LPRRGFDDAVAAYCNLNLDLMTGDAKSYTHFFEAGIESVNVTSTLGGSKGTALSIW
jgi:hypothetical protein